jgi:hypothetical protein
MIRSVKIKIHTALSFAISGSVFLVAVCMFSIQSAHAESVVWNSPAPLYRMCNHSSCGVYGLSNVFNQVTYRISVTNTATGVPIASNSIVPKGTTVTFKFIPHVSNDVYWYSAGYNYDSPYGDWVAGAARPTGNMCIEKNHINYGDARGDAHQGLTYATLSVAPPTKSIAGLPPGCTTATDDVSKLCTLNETGTLSLEFNFASTVGKFYGAGGLLKGGSTSCTDPALLDILELATVNHTFTIQGSPSRSTEYKQFCGATFGSAGNCTLVSTTGECRSQFGSFIPDTCSSTYTYTTQGTKSSNTVSVPTQTIPFSLTVASVSGNPPGSPTLTPRSSTSGSTSCTTGTPYTIAMSATDPEGDQIRYGIDWDNDGSVNEFVPASGYVPSGTLRTASRTFTVAGSKTVRVFAQDSQGNASGWTSLSFTCTAPAQANMAVEDTTTDDSDGSGIGTGGTGGSTSPDLSLRVVPSLVSKGSASRVTWSAANVASCIVSGENGDSWTGLTSPIGGRATLPITQRTTYTLTCRAGSNTLVKSATVNVLPNWQEQ